MLPLDLEDLTGLGLALALGLLIGIQRGWALRDGAPGSRFAGVRTFGLLGLAGGIAGALHGNAEGLATVLLAASAALVVIGYWRATQRSSSISGTSAMVGLLTMACGFLAGGGNYAMASAASGVMVLVLAMRNQLHGWVRAIDEAEMQAIARFALIALVVLPLLPDTRFGPYLAWHPRQLWLVVVLVCGFSFAGYIAARKLGASRGLLATAAAGSVVSSTAVTASMAEKLRDEAGDPRVVNAAIALASAVMFARVMVLTGALAGYVLPLMALWAVPGLLVSLGGAGWLVHRSRHAGGIQDNAVALRNPFALGPALLLMLLVMVLTAAARWVQERWGDAGLATVLALSGMMDVDSAIITMGNLPPGSLAPATGALVLMPPVLLNTAIKAGTAIGIAGWRKGWPGAAVLLASLGASLATLPLLL
ncbi:MgtC/SapB family protein [Novosphingobium sp. B 225]|uniref:MgtC/SapB family protein n=1 Tax=Novosphingobium sp. B 225 TaxID=1961849 RepID=UPI000B4A9813|nr:DUF4010 domain-containing protein [Novosphingobium sp. B 225]